LTLRTLLSYLDDTLDPAQTKLIGAKVADSEQARDLTERIKQVTRRRRLTTPPATGPGGIDANTIAEYLDNDVTPETSAEVEQICLASDVHLAEVAACHQILTLVLGEPALVPPSAKQRMYGLVKGPEAIPFRRAARAVKNDNDLSSEIEPDHDDSLRLGVPAVAGAKDQRNLILLAGGGVLAACLLAFAIYMLVGPGHGGNANVGELKTGGDVPLAQGDGKNKDQGEPKNDDKKKTPEDKGNGKGFTPPPPKKDDDDPKPFVPEVTPVPVKPDTPPVAEFAYAPASTKQVAVGKYIPPNVKAPAVLLQMKSEKAGWTRLADKDVISGRPLLSLPGSKSVVALNSDVELTLWGNLVELTFDPYVAESRAILHDNDLLDADVTLQRGRIVLRNNKKGEKEARVRVRFNNPTTTKLFGEEKYFDFVLHAGSAVLLERFSVMDREPFFDNQKDELRLGPTATMWVYAYGGSANIRSEQVSYLLDETQLPLLQWRSRGGVLGPPDDPKRIPPAPSAEPVQLKDKDKVVRQQARDAVVRAHAELVGLLEKKEIDVALAEIMQSVQKAADREGKKMSGDTYLSWQYAIRCYTAIDGVDFLFREFAADTTPTAMRFLYMQALQQWIAQERENDYQLLEVLNKTYRPKTTSLNIMHLFHATSREDALKPGTYEHLIEGLNNELMPIRMLSHFHLINMVPEGWKIPYDPGADAQFRKKAVREWLAMIPPGKLPPGMSAPKEKDKN
jgi:hypothetical protein